MKNNLLLPISAVAAFILPLLIYNFGNLSTFTISEFNSILNVLLTISSIVFAIVGAWIAIIYPNAIRKYFAEGRSSIEAEAKLKNISTSALQAEIKAEINRVKDNLLALVNIVILSSIVLISALSIKVLHPVLESFNFFSIDLNILKTIGIGLLVFLSILQFYSICSVMKRNYDFYRQLELEYEKAKEASRKY